MAFSEALSDTGDLPGRGSPYLRGAITGAGTFTGGILHTLPFLIPQYRAALAVAVVVIALELLALAWIRWRFFSTGFVRSFLSITLREASLATQRPLCPPPAPSPQPRPPQPPHRPAPP